MRPVTGSSLSCARARRRRGRRCRRPGARCAASSSAARLIAALAAARSIAAAIAVDLALADRHLDRDLVRQLAERADVADDERLAERERADGAPRRSRPSSASAATTTRRRRRAATRARPPGRSRDGSRAPGARARRQPRRPRADEQQACVRVGRAAGERLEQLRDPLALVHVPEAADHRAARDRLRVDRRHGPGRHRHLRDRPA